MIIPLLVFALIHISCGGGNFLFYGEKENTLFPLLPEVHDGHVDGFEELHEKPFALTKPDGADHYTLRLRSITEEAHEEHGDHDDHKRRRRRRRHRVLSREGGHEGEEDEHHDEEEEHFEPPLAHVALRLLYVSPGLHVSGFDEDHQHEREDHAVELPFDFEFELESADISEFVATFQLVSEGNATASEVFNVTSPVPVAPSAAAQVWLADVISSLDSAGFQQLFDAHFAEDLTGRSACFEAATLFATFDADQDAQLSAAELVGATSSLSNMLLRGCHLPRAVADVAAAVCPPLEGSTTAQKWGYTFLALILCSLPAVAMAALLPVEQTLLKKVALNAGIAVSFGSTVGVVLFQLIPYFSRTLTSFSVLQLDGPTSVTSVETDYIFPFIVMAVVVMICFLVERLLHAWHRDQAHGGGSIKVIFHDGLQTWQELKGMDAAENSVEVSTEAHPWKTLHVSVFLSMPLVASVSLVLGLVVGAAFAVAPRVGLYVAVWAFVTQLFLLCSVFFILVAGNLSPTFAVLWPFLFAVGFHLLGGIIGAAVGATATAAARYLAALACGFVAYVGVADVAPLLTKQMGHKRVLGQLVLISVPIIALFCLGFFLKLPVCGPILV